MDGISTLLLCVVFISNVDDHGCLQLHILVALIIVCSHTIPARLYSAIQAPYVCY